MLQEVSARLTLPGEVPLRYLILDFERVDGADSSTIFSFIRLIERAEQQRCSILFAALPETVATALRSAGLDRPGAPQLHVFRDLDHSLEHAEDAVIDAAPDNGDIEHAVDELERDLSRIAVREDILAYGTRVTWRAGDYVLRQGDESEEMYFIESGRLTARLDLAGSSAIRLRTIMPGTVIGEVACYLGLPRSASVIADRDSSAFRITKRALRRMQTENPELAVVFHEFMARTAAERLAHNTRLIGARSL